MAIELRDDGLCPLCFATIETDIRLAQVLKERDDALIRVAAGTRLLAKALDSHGAEVRRMRDEPDRLRAALREIQVRHLDAAPEAVAGDFDGFLRRHGIDPATLEADE